MDEKEGLNGSGVEPRVENPDPLLNFSGSIATLSPPPPAGVAAAPPPTTEARKKRGRPRKYAGDGSVVALSPMPISASIPLTGDYSAWKQSSGKPVGSFKKKHKLESQNPGGMMAYSLGASFTPHVITVNTGEDIMMKIISFSQQGSRAICILAANGAISNVTLRQADSSGGTLTYEGRFEILSLTGSFMPNDNGLTKSRSGGMSVSLAGPDGRVLGGGLAGMLVAAGPVQVVIGSFLPTGHQLEQKPKKPKHEQTITFAPILANPVSEEQYETTYHGPKPNSTPFQVHNLPSVNPVHGSNITGLDNNNSILFSGEEDSREQSHDLAC